MLTNTELLNLKIKESGFKKEFLAKEIGIKRSTLYKKVNNQLDFKDKEIQKLCKLLKLTKTETFQIFFGN